MSQPLPDDYLVQCEQDARRFQGAYTGTAGTLAAHVIRLLTERKRLLAMLNEQPQEKDGNGFYR